MDRIFLGKEYYKQPFVVNSFIKNVLFGLAYMIMIFLADAWEMRSLAVANTIRKMGEKKDEQ